jgi:hypothetical protein
MFANRQKNHKNLFGFLCSDNQRDKWSQELRLGFPESVKVFASGQEVAKSFHNTVILTFYWNRDKKVRQEDGVFRKGQTKGSGNSACCSEAQVLSLPKSKD